MIQVIPAEPRHRQDWDRLYAGYAEFYRVTQTQAMRDTVWSWILDPGHETMALIAEDEAGRALGLAHLRPFARPLAASTGGFLDDLFVDPASRGSGVVQALFTAMKALAAARGWTTIRWITADNNYRGRAVYDRHATRTMWITYDMAP